MVVDDLGINRYTLFHHFESEGWNVIEAVSGAEAIRVATEKQPDLITLDVRLDDMSGYTVGDRLKNDSRTAHILIILLSATFEREIPDEAYRHGADAVLPQPVDPELLITTMRKLLAAPNQADELRAR